MSLLNALSLLLYLVENASFQLICVVIIFSWGLYLIGHSGSISGISHIPKSPFYISFDINMSVIVSDVRNGEIY